MHELALKDEIPITVSESFQLFSNQDAFTYCDVLMTEVARQLHDDGGIPMSDASKLVWNAGVAAGLKTSGIRATYTQNRALPCCIGKPQSRFRDRGEDTASQASSSWVEVQLSRL